MRGLDDMERLVLAVFKSPEEPTGVPSDAEYNATVRLWRRGLLGNGGPCPHCGGHPTIVVTATGLEVERLDKIAREEISL